MGLLSGFDDLLEDGDRLSVLCQVFEDDGEVEHGIDGAGVLVAVERLVLLHDAHEYAPGFFSVPVQLVQEGLIVVNTELGWVVSREKFLNVLLVRVQDNLRLTVLPQGHALLELLQGLLHTLEIFLLDVRHIVECRTLRFLL